MSRRPSAPRARTASSGGAGSAGGRPSPARTATASRPPTARPSARPGAARPGQARTPASDVGREDDEPRTVHLARLLSVRALVLAVVLLVGFTMLFPTVRAYLGQQAELAALADQVSGAEQREEDLAAERARWDDPAYVEAQARERLGYVQPGETSYRVVDPEVVVEVPVVQGGTTGSVAGPTLPAGGAVAPWYSTVWESVRLAGESPMPGDAPTEPPAAGDVGDAPTPGDAPAPGGATGPAVP